MKNKKIYFGLVILAIAVLTFIIYSNTFDSEFHFDDYDSIVNAYDIRSLKNIIGIFRVNPRFITYYTFAINYYFGKLDVFGYHLVNILLHIFCASLVSLFIWLTLNLPRLKERYASSSRWIAFFAGLLFAAHPVKVEAVTYITARSETLSSCIYLLGFVFFIKSVVEGTKYCSSEPANLSSRLNSKNEFAGESRTYIDATVKQKAFQKAAIITTLVGMATKEIMFTLPVNILLFDYLFVAGGDFKQLRMRIKFYLQLFAAILLGIFLRLTHSTGGSCGFSSKEIPSPINYFFTQFRVFLYYLKLLFLPHPALLNFDTYFPASKSFFEAQTLICFLACCAIIIFAILNLKKRPLLAYFIFWFFILLAPSSSFYPFEDVMYERRLYLASLGWTMVVLLAAVKLKPKLRYGILTGVILIFSIWTFQRNAVWKTELSLWQDCMNKSPLKPRTHVNYGYLFMKMGDLDTAEAHMLEALRIEPKSSNAQLDLGLIYYLRGRYDLAIELFKDLTVRYPEYSSAHSDLGTVYRKKGMLDEAEKEFKEALRIVPDFAEAHGNLGLVYIQKGMAKQAVEEELLAMRLNPDIAEPHVNLGLILQGMKDEEKARQEFQKAVELNPVSDSAHYNLGISYLRAGRISEARNELAILEHLRSRQTEKLRAAIGI